MRSFEIGSTFEVPDVVVDKWNLMNGEPIPASSLSSVSIDACVFPASITFLVRNCGGTPGRLHVEISDEATIEADDPKSIFVN